MTVTYNVKGLCSPEFGIAEKSHQVTVIFDDSSMIDFKPEELTLFLDAIGAAIRQGLTKWGDVDYLISNTNKKDKD